MANSKQPTAEGRKQKAESKRQTAGSRKQKADSSSYRRLVSGRLSLFRLFAVYCLLFAIRLFHAQQLDVEEER